MKKQIITAAIAIGAILFGTTQAQAQTAETEVNIILSDVISIDDGSEADGGVVDFEYNTSYDYNETQTANEPNSLIVTSSNEFDVKVKAEGINFSNGTGSDIPVNVLTLKPLNGENTTMGGTQQNVVLSTNYQTLISGAGIGSELALEMNYEIPANESSSDKMLGKPEGTYTQTVKYTITAQ